MLLVELIPVKNCRLVLFKVIVPETVRLSLNVTPEVPEVPPIVMLLNVFPFVTINALALLAAKLNAQVPVQFCVIPLGNVIVAPDIP